jgi:hypothetical protein
MSQDVSDAFISQFESEVHVAYQRMGSKLRNLVRQKNNINGSNTTFQKMSKGNAVQKARHAEAPPMNVTHSTVNCTLGDWYAPDYVDKLDELKINIDERGVLASNGAYALGRKTDELITDVMTGSSNSTAHGSAGMTQAKINTVFESFGNNDIPDDGERYWAVSPAGWVDLLGLDAFANADYVGSGSLPYQGGMVAKQFMGFMFFGFSGLPLATADRDTYAWHKSAIGHASGADVKSEINYIPEKVSHYINSMMSQGACLIDQTGLYEVHIDES